jgi:hypothetical protein
MMETNTGAPLQARNCSGVLGERINAAPFLGEQLHMHGHTPLQANNYSVLGDCGECVKSCCTCGIF